MTKQVLLGSLEDTWQLAKDIAPTLQAGDVIALSGELGAGKTYFTQCLCKILGVEESVSSPTFVILNEYKANNFPIYHFDLYRLEDEYEVLDLGIMDMVEDGLTIIEWPELTERLLPQKKWRLVFHYDGAKRWVDVIS
jgi:tRNA threonylcarbamoyladenosine biosynthesis protein TsaE